MKNTRIPISFRRMVCLAALFVAATVDAQPKPAEPDMQDAFAAQMEQEMLVGAVTLHSRCKDRSPKDAAQIDANLKKDIASMSPRAIAYAKTDAFKSRVAVRKKEQALDADAKTEEGIQLLREMCSQITASANK